MIARLKILWESSGPVAGEETAESCPEAQAEDSISFGRARTSHACPYCGKPAEQLMTIKDEEAFSWLALLLA